MSDITVCIARIDQSSASEAVMRTHRIVIDRPREKGGGDAGAMGGEMLLASFGGCFMSNLIAAAESREIPLDGVGATVSGTLEGTPARFTRIVLEVTGKAPTKEEMERLVQIAERACIVRNTLKGSVAVTVSVADSTGHDTLPGHG